jgi:hypothetical protein
LDVFLGVFPVECLLALVTFLCRNRDIPEDANKLLHIAVMETASIHLVQE